MIENSVTQENALSTENSNANFAKSPGQMLKQARMDAGLHIAALAVSLRVPVKRIEALENDQTDLLPDTVFTRALALSICQVLKTDAAPILKKLPKVEIPKLNRDDIAINTPISVVGLGKAPSPHVIFSSTSFVSAIFLVLAAAGIYFWPHVSQNTFSEPVTPPKSVLESGVSQAKELLVVAEKPVPAAAEVSTSIATASPRLPFDHVVVFRATGETWVEVKNAAGSTMFKKLLSSGETAGTSGTLPLTVIVGRVDATQVEVRGKPVDLMAIAKSNVARFEVN